MRSTLSGAHAHTCRRPGPPGRGPPSPLTHTTAMLQSRVLPLAPAKAIATVVRGTVEAAWPPPPPGSRDADDGQRPRPGFLELLGNREASTKS